jgi:hypothetical protein
MKGLVGIAVLLGIIGTVLGVVALMDDGGGFEEKTLTLQGGEETDRIEFPVETASGSHPFARDAFTASREITGDATGVQTVLCVPVAGDVVECNGAFIHDDGEIEIEGSEPAAEDGQATSAIVGGTGAYKGAIGEIDIDFENYEFTLDYVVPSD